MENDEIMQVLTNLTDVINELTPAIELELNEDNKNAISKIDETVLKYDLKWEFKNVNHALNKLNLGFTQLRLFDDRGNSVKNIIQIGLLGTDDDKACDIVQELLDAKISLPIMHVLLIRHLEKKPFFMDTQAIQNAKNLVLSGEVPEDVSAQALLRGVTTKLLEQATLNKKM